MTYGEITRRLKELGCVEFRQGKGSHVYWRNPATEPFPLSPIGAVKIYRQVQSGPLFASWA